MKTIILIYILIITSNSYSVAEVGENAALNKTKDELNILVKYKAIADLKGHLILDRRVGALLNVGGVLVRIVSEKDVGKHGELVTLRGEIKTTKLQLDEKNKENKKIMPQHDGLDRKYFIVIKK